MSAAPDQPGPQAITAALDAARYLIQQGVPVFVAPPKAVSNPLKELEFFLPSGWQQTEPDPTVLDTWRPGMALCAVMGRGLDLIDVDTYKGASATALNGLLPTVLGTAVSPSGGEHYFVASLGVHSKNDAWPGIDVKAGAPDGAGRGFAFIAPTVRTSKADGTRRSYAWTVVPTVVPPDGSGAAFAAAVTKPKDAAPPPTVTVRPTGDMWQDQANGWYARRLTQAQATQTVQNAPAAVAAGRAGDYRVTLYHQAALLGELTAAWVGDPIEGNGWLGKEYAAQLLLRAAEDAWGEEATAEGMGQDERIIADGMAKGAQEPRWVVPDTAPVPPPGVSGPVAGDHATGGRPSFRDMLVDIDGLRRIPAPEPLVDGWLFKDSLSWVSGEPGTGKSLVVIDLVCCIATGRRWHGFQVAQGPVLYIIAEGLRGMSARVDAWTQKNQSGRPPVTFLPWATQLTNPADVAELEELIREQQYAVVVVDTQSRATVGVDENAAKDMGVLVHNLDRLRQASGACVLTVHHTARGANNLRGSSVVTGAADSTLLLTRDAQAITVKADKQKDTADGATLVLQMVPVAGSVTVTAQADSNGTVGRYTDTERRILNHLRLGNAWSPTELMDALGLAKSSVYDAVRGLRERGDIYLTDSTQPKRYAAAVLGPQISAYEDGSQEGNGPHQPVDNPVDNRRNLLRNLGQIPEPDSGESGEQSEDKRAGHSVIPEESESLSEPLDTDSGPPPPFRGAGKSESSDLPDSPESSSGPKPEPRKRAEPRPGTKAYERAQAKAAEKAERIALAAGRRIEYPAVVQRGQPALEVPLSAAETLLEGLPVVTVDVETSGVPVGHKDFRLKLIQLGCAEFAIDLDPDDPEQAQLAARTLQSAPQLRAHSSIADVVPTALAGLCDFDSMMERMDDTAIRAKLNDPQSTGSDAGLKKISDHMLGEESASTPADAARKELFAANGWVTEVEPDTLPERNGWMQVDPHCETFAVYGGSDVLDTALIGDRLPQLPQHIADRERLSAQMVGRISLLGVPINGPKVMDLMDVHTAKRAELGQQITSWTSIDNVGSGQQVAQALTELGVLLPYTKPTVKYPNGQPSVAAGVLETLQGQLEITNPDHPALVLINQVLDWRHHNTVITLFLTPYSVLTRDGDGRARPTVYTFGADTGRMSCVRPNFQQLPREGGVRSIITADEGMCFISADFSSVEIRVAAALSQDQALIRMLEEGLDPHGMAAAIVFGPNYTKAQRYKVKSGVFGRIYGGGVSTLAEQMRVPIHVAQKLIDAIDTLWPTLSAWTKACTHAVERGLETTYTTYSGRIIHLPKHKAHAAGNYKIQGVAKELLTDALIKWHATQWGTAIMWPVHDELDVMVPIAEAEAATAALVGCMESELYGVRIIAEPSEPSTYWADSA